MKISIPLMKPRALIAVLLFMTGPVLAQVTPSPPGSVLSAAGGRYVFGQTSEYQKNTYMLDTHTGRLWQVACSQVDKDNSLRCLLTVMMPIPFVDSRGELTGTFPPTMGK